MPIPNLSNEPVLDGLGTNSRGTAHSGPVRSDSVCSLIQCCFTTALTTLEDKGLNVGILVRLDGSVDPRPSIHAAALPRISVALGVVLKSVRAVTVDGNCKSQESPFTLMYTLGVFAVNFGQAIVGPFLDALGAKLVRTVKLPNPKALTSYPKLHFPLRCVSPSH